MNRKLLLGRLEKLDALAESIRQASRIPGLAIAIADKCGTIFVRGYGYRDLEAELPMTEKTVYPIASTTKAINATLLGILVDEGRLAWDTPVQCYLPSFYLGDRVISAQVTLRDLVTMRTGLPRHDWLWMDCQLSRAELVERLRYLALSARFRERYQYNNLTVTAAGHIAEIVTGWSWEALVKKKIIEPLAMTNTRFGLPMTDNVSLSYHENDRRELVMTKRLTSQVTAPSGGAIHSTIEDMALWLSFNLNDGRTGESPVVSAQSLATIHSPQMVVGEDPASPTPCATYAMGWFVDSYNGCARLSHAGYLHDVNSEIMIFPEKGIGIVSFINFGSPRLARLINEHVFDALMECKSTKTVQQHLLEYEKEIESARRRKASVLRVYGTTPSHSLNEYVGKYMHRAYGTIEITMDGERLSFSRNSLVLPLEHWHYDAWMVGQNDLFELHRPHAFDSTRPILFDTGAAGNIISLFIQMEPAVPPIHFVKQ